MKKKKRRFGFFDDFFDDFFEEFEEIFSQGSGPISGGYSISVYQTPEGTIVEAQVSDDVDVDSFRKMLEEKYPGAKIVIKGGRKGKIIERVKEPEEKKVTIRLVEEEEKPSEESNVPERDELSDILSGGRRRVFIKREEDE